jgi:hypothetical protein
MTHCSPFRISFAQVSRYVATIDAISESEAIGKAEAMCNTLSGKAKKKAFELLATGYEDFKIAPVLMPFRVSVDARAIYEIEVEARDRYHAEDIAKVNWNARGPSEFSFEDCMDVSFEAEEVEP